MVKEVVLCYPTHRKSHPSLYESYNGDDDLPSLLCDTICSGEQYLRLTSWGIWYLPLKASILAGESTRLTNLPIWTT